MGQFTSSDLFALTMAWKFVK